MKLRYEELRQQLRSSDATSPTMVVSSESDDEAVETCEIAIDIGGLEIAPKVNVEVGNRMGISQSLKKMVEQLKWIKTNADILDAEFRRVTGKGTRNVTTY